MIQFQTTWWIQWWVKLAVVGRNTEHIIYGAVLSLLQVVDSRGIACKLENSAWVSRCRHPIIQSINLLKIRSETRTYTHLRAVMWARLLWTSLAQGRRKRGGAGAGWCHSRTLTPAGSPPGDRGRPPSGTVITCSEGETMINFDQKKHPECFSSESNSQKTIVHSPLRLSKRLSLRVSLKDTS